MPTPPPPKRITIVQQEGSLAELTATQGEALYLSCKAYLGKNGVSFDRKAGDRTTPGGTFTFGQAFGIEPDPGNSLLPYRQVTPKDYWVGDSSSEYYNQWRTDDDPEDAWSRRKSEHLIDYGRAYHYAVSINFNTPDPVPGKGSAIFLHCIGEKTYTAGCVAVPREDMLALLAFIDAQTTVSIQAAP